MNINMSNAQYKEMYEEASHGTKWWITIPKAFFFGGLICAIGQAFYNMYSFYGLSQENCGTATSITLVFLSALFISASRFGKQTDLLK